MAFAQLTWSEGLRDIATCSLGRLPPNQSGNQVAYIQIDLRGPIPTCIYISGARAHDVLWLDDLIFDPGAFSVMDRAYMDFKRLNLIARAGDFFVIRTKDNLRFSRQHSRPLDRAAGVSSDQIGRSTLTKGRKAFPVLLRKVRYFDQETRRFLVFLTNHLEIPALTVAHIYRSRWRIELFFRWDQKSPAHQALLRHESQCGENSNLDCHGRLPDGGDPSQTTESSGHIAQNFAAFECSPL